MQPMHVYRIWRSGDDLLLVFPDIGEIELTRDKALALAAEISGCYTAPVTAPQVRHNRHWTTEERAEVCRLYQQGMGAAEVARQMNITGPQVYPILRRAGIPAHDKKASNRAKKMMARRRAA